MGLKKSGIEYVILAGSSLLGVFEGKHLVFVVRDGFRAAQRAIFSRISGSWYPIAQNFARPQGNRGASVWEGHQDGSSAL